MTTLYVKQCAWCGDEIKTHSLQRLFRSLVRHIDAAHLTPLYRDIDHWEQRCRVSVVAERELVAVA